MKMRRALVISALACVSSCSGKARIPRLPFVVQRGGSSYDAPGDYDEGNYYHEHEQQQHHEQQAYPPQDIPPELPGYNDGYPGVSDHQSHLPPPPPPLLPEQEGGYYEEPLVPPVGPEEAMPFDDMMGHDTTAPDTDLGDFDKEYIMQGLAKLYRKKILPLELASRYGHFHSPPLSPSDFEAPPMVLLLGQYR
jgi:hypothetical protein